MKNRHAVAIGRLGGLAGKGKPKNRTPEQLAALIEAARIGKAKAKAARQKLREQQ